MDNKRTAEGLQLWGALDVTLNRVLDAWFSQVERSIPVQRDDLERFAGLGLKAIRYPLTWERYAPTVGEPDWTWPDRRLPELRRRGIAPVVGLVHHGWLPRHASLAAPDFGWQLAQFAGAVARRYPWVEHYTPVSAPLATARFIGADGGVPRGEDEYAFVQALLGQCRAVVLAMRAVRAVNPRAKLVQNDEPGKAWATPELAHLAGFHNQRRWLTWDLLCGRVERSHPLWDYLLSAGVGAGELLWFRDHPCPPDIIGIDHDLMSERWLDRRAQRYPARCLRRLNDCVHADIEAARALATPTRGIAALLAEAWERYRLPLALTEARVDANREDQLRWLLEMWNGALAARAAGADVRAVAVYPLLGAYDWNSLATSSRGRYQHGAFAVDKGRARATALAGMMRELAAGQAPSNPVLREPGWWRSPGRFHCEPVATNSVVADLSARRRHAARAEAPPILVAGAAGMLGSAFVRICEKRNLACRALTRHEMDIADPAAVEAAIARHRPWAIVNAAGQSCIDEAETDPRGCVRDNVDGPAVLARACARHGLRLLVFSSDQVFDGRRNSPWLETDPPAPLNAYGASQAAAERQVLSADPRALLVRTSALFGPWDKRNFVTRALAALDAGEAFAAPCDLIVSPTYVPDLVHACLDLLIDGEHGIWHLANCEAMSWAELARRACVLAGIDPAALAARPWASLPHAAPRPAFSALHSAREILLPALDDALARYVHQRAAPDEQDAAGLAANYGR